MNTNKNCWEFRKCGRQPGGDEVEELGVCPASTHLEANRINNGINAGRACWVITGTMCEGKTAGNFSQKLGNCMECEFYTTVRREEAKDFKSSKTIIEKLNGSLNRNKNESVATDNPLKVKPLSWKK